MIEGHCKDYLQKFSEYIDGELAPELCAKIEAHLKDCKNCTIVLNTLRRTIDLVHETKGAENLPDEVRERLYKRLSLDDLDNSPGTKE